MRRRSRGLRPWPRLLTAMRSRRQLPSSRVGWRASRRDPGGEGATGHDAHRSGDGRCRGGAPRFCQVDGHAASPGNEVNFRLGLPERWNGKFLLPRRWRAGRQHRPTSNTGSRAAMPPHPPTPVTCRAIRLGLEPRQGDRLRPSRHARDARSRARHLTGAFYGTDRAARLLRRLLERRAPGADGSAALSRPTSTASSPAIPQPARRCRWAARSSIRRCSRRPDELPHAPSQVELLSKATLAGVRQDRRPGGRTGHRPAPLHLQPRDAEMLGRRRA